MRARLDRGDRCFVAREAGTIVSSRWIAGRRAYVEYLGTWLDLEPDEVFLSETFTVPAPEGPRGVRRGGHAARARARGGRLSPYPRRRAHGEPRRQAGVREGGLPARRPHRLRRASGRCEGASEASGPPVRAWSRSPAPSPGRSGRSFATASSCWQTETGASARPSPMPPSTSRTTASCSRGKTSIRARFALRTTSRGCPLCRETRFGPTPGDSARRIPASSTA